MMNKERTIKENVCSESPWRAVLNSLVSAPRGKLFNLQPSLTLCTARGNGSTFCLSFNKREMEPWAEHEQKERGKAFVIQQRNTKLKFIWLLCKGRGLSYHRKCKKKKGKLIMLYKNMRKFLLLGRSMDLLVKYVYHGSYDIKAFLLQTQNQRFCMKPLLPF